MLLIFLFARSYKWPIHLYTYMFERALGGHSFLHYLILIMCVYRSITCMPKSKSRFIFVRTLLNNSIKRVRFDRLRVGLNILIFIFYRWWWWWWLNYLSWLIKKINSKRRRWLHINVKNIELGSNPHIEYN